MISILSVDHDLVCRGLSTLTIWQLGYWNDVVSSSERALQAFKKRQYDLVFIDLAMPDMDGFTLARTMRDMERENRQQPALICAMSVIDDVVLRQRCRDAGMEEFIGRPCSCDDLRCTIRLGETVALMRAGGDSGSGARCFV
jgi:CheY-like chemotaxis protein